MAGVLGSLLDVGFLKKGLIVQNGCIIGYQFWFGNGGFQY